MQAVLMDCAMQMISFISTSEEGGVKPRASCASHLQRAGTAFVPRCNVPACKMPTCSVRVLWVVRE